MTARLTTSSPGLVTFSISLTGTGRGLPPTSSSIVAPAARALTTRLNLSLPLLSCRGMLAAGLLLLLLLLALLSLAAICTITSSCGNGLGCCRSAALPLGYLHPPKVQGVAGSRIPVAGGAESSLSCAQTFAHSHTRREVCARAQHNRRDLPHVREPDHQTANRAMSATRNPVRDVSRSFLRLLFDLLPAARKP